MNRLVAFLLAICALPVFAQALIVDTAGYSPVQIDEKVFFWIKPDRGDTFTFYGVDCSKNTLKSVSSPDYTDLSNDKALAFKNTAMQPPKGDDVALMKKVCGGIK